METTLKVVYDEELFKIFGNIYEVLKEYFYVVEVTERRRPDLEELNDDDVVQWFYSWMKIK